MPRKHMCIPTAESCTSQPWLYRSHEQVELPHGGPDASPGTTVRERHGRCIRQRMPGLAIENGAYDLAVGTLVEHVCRVRPGAYV